MNKKKTSCLNELANARADPLLVQTPTPAVLQFSLQGFGERSKFEIFSYLRV